MANYDPDVIRKMADKLYARANSIIYSWSVVGVIAGGVAGVIVRLEAAPRLGIPEDSSAIWLVVAPVVLICGFLGLAYGRGKAFQLKVEAQRLLCQVEIEANTR